MGLIAEKEQKLRREGPALGNSLTRAGHSVKVLQLDFNNQVKLNAQFSLYPVNISLYK